MPTSAWTEHVRAVKAANPGLTLPQASNLAKQTYVKQGKRAYVPTGRARGRPRSLYGPDLPTVSERAFYNIPQFGLRAMREREKAAARAYNIGQGRKMYGPAKPTRIERQISRAKGYRIPRMSGVPRELGVYTPPFAPRVRRVRRQPASRQLPPNPGYAMIPDAPMYNVLDEYPGDVAGPAIQYGPIAPVRFKNGRVNKAATKRAMAGL